MKETTKPIDFPRSLVVHYEGERDVYLELHTEGHGQGMRVGETRLEATYTLERVVEVSATVEMVASGRATSTKKAEGEGPP